MLSHFLRAVPKGSTTPFYTYNTTVSSTTNSTSYTFSSVNIGTAASNRLVVIVVLGRPTVVASRIINSATIGGVSATLVSNESSGNPAAIISAVITSGTTADVVINWNSSMDNCVISSYSLYDLNSTTAASSVAAQGASAWVSGKITVELSVQKDGISIGGVTTSATTGTPATWSGLTEDYDQVVETRTRSSASRQMTNNDSNFKVEVTISGSTAGVLAVAHWR